MTQQPADLPTQLAHPARAILRTTVQAIVGGAAAWATRVTAIEIAPEVVGVVVDVITSLAWIAGTAAAAWVMSRPVVARWLEPTILAPAPPRRAIGGRP